MSTATTLAESNCALGRRFFAEQDRLRGGPAPELCAPGYEATIGGMTTDRAGHEGFATGFYAAFPTVRHRIEEVFATDDRVAVRFTLAAPHQGSFFGIPATNCDVSISANVILDVADGKVTRLRALFDEAGLLRQIGVLQG
ncbi:MAG TPA: ester cyclase [Gemmatimonadaceae bacterium]|nr:ester cyclase [Gemmatimonadaceae bacterium]